MRELLLNNLHWLWASFDYNFEYDFLDLNNLSVTFYIEFPTIYITDMMTQFVSYFFNIEDFNFGFEVRIIGWFLDFNFVLQDGVIADFSFNTWFDRGGPFPYILNLWYDYDYGYASETELETDEEIVPELESEIENSETGDETETASTVDTENETNHRPWLFVFVVISFSVVFYCFYGDVRALDLTEVWMLNNG